MKIGFVLGTNYPVDREIRTRKMAKSLSRRGHDVTIYARNDQEDPARGKIRDEPDEQSEDIGYAMVRRFTVFPKIPIHRYVTAPLPFNPFWILWIMFLLRRDSIDVVISNDIRAGPTAIVGAKLLGLPIAVDVRENYVELGKLVGGKSVVDRIKTNNKLIGAIERFLYHFSDALWVVTEERKVTLTTEGEKNTKVRVVHNSPDISRQANDLNQSSETSFSWSGFTIVYVGVLNDFRGLDLIIEALAKLDSESIDYHLSIAGDGPYRSELKRKCRELDVRDQVSFVGWIDPEKIPDFLSSGTLGVIPHWVTGFTNTTVPNKLFDYMLAELPVLATDMKPVSRIISNENCGATIPVDASPVVVAEQIEAMAKSSNLEEMGINGRKAVEKRYNWDHEMETVEETIETIIDRMEV